MDLWCFSPDPKESREGQHRQVVQTAITVDCPQSATKAANGFSPKNGPLVQ